MSGEFKKSLGVFDATMLVVGSMIGSGIFIVSADIARTVGSPFLLLAAWLVTGLITLAAALSYGELAGMFPQAGGQYVYIREAFGDTAGFLYGWTLFAVIQTGTIAAVAVAFAKYTGVFFEAVSENSILLEWGTIKISGAQLLAVCSIWFLTAMNNRGIREGKFVQNIFTIVKSVALGFVILAGFVWGANAVADTANFGEGFFLLRGDAASLTPEVLLMAFGAALVGSLFSSDAWNNITFTAGEVKNPEKTIPRSLVYGVGIVTVLYILVNLSYLTVLPLGSVPLDSIADNTVVAGGETALAAGIQHAANDRVGAALAEVTWGNSGALFMAALIMFSTFGCNNGLILSGARAYFAMAKQGVFFRKAATLNKAGAPSSALYIQAVWASILCLSGKYGDLLDYVVFAVLIFYIVTVAGIFRLRKTRPDASRPYKAFGYPVIPALYMVVATAIAVNLLIVKPNYSYTGLFIVLLGLPIYYIQKMLKKSTDF